MSDANKAVFLSYASQDADAAKRICEALRAAGVEVWFDQSELVGGDAWDQKIRKQIKDCALLIPIISAATQARTEGYFRLEWRLADQRTHLMAKGRPFLLPVVIDDTRDAEAQVPDSFTEVQWTRLPGGEAAEKFGARVRKLLGGEGTEDIRLRQGFDGQGNQRTEVRAAAQAQISDKQPRRWLAPVIGGVVVALLALIIARPWQKAAVPPDAGKPAATAKPAASLTEAQKLVEQAQAIFAKSDELDRETLFLADDLVKRALVLDPAEPSAWELAARLSYLVVWQSFDTTEAREAELLRQAARARALAPESESAQLAVINAQLAVAFSNFQSASNRQTLEAIERDLLVMAERAPHDYHVQQALGQTYRFLNKPDEALRALQRSLELSGGDPGVSGHMINVLLRRKRYAEAEALVAPALARRPIGRILVLDVMFKTVWRGDLAGAQAALAAWPGWLIREDRGAFLAWQTWMWSGRPDRALDVASRLSRDYLRDNWFTGPRAVLTARAHELAGHAEAAQADWRTVVRVADRELAGGLENDAAALFWKAWALSRLGDQAGATAITALLQQRNLNSVAFFSTTSIVSLWSTMGRTDLAADYLRASFVAVDDSYAVTRKMLELDPAYAPLRADPHFAELAAAALAPDPTPSSGALQIPSAPAQPKIDDKSVAVLPFANLSGDKEQEYFSDGLTEEILNTLARERDLRVPGRASSFSFKGKNASSAEIAQALNVARLVEGSVRKSGNKVRISVSLTRAADGFSEELGTFTEELSDIFALQDKVARAVVEKLTHRSVTTVAVGLTKNAEAYDAYLKGRALQTRSADFALKAAAFYEQAVALDPGFALAWARLAEARFRSFGAQLDRSPEVIKGARFAIDQALAAQPDLPEALTIRAQFVRSVEFDYPAAQRDLERAESLQSATAELRFVQGSLARDQGNWPEAARLFREALQLDPQNGDNANAFAVSVCLPRGDYVEADQLLRRAMVIQGTGAATPFSNLIFARNLWRGPEAALRLLDRMPATQAGLVDRRVSLLVSLGRLDEARALADKLDFTTDAPGAAFLSTGVAAKAGLLLALGRDEQARQKAMEIVANASREFARGNRAPLVRNAFIRAEILLGHRESALAVLQEWREEAQRMPSTYRRVQEYSSTASALYALLGQADESVALLRELKANGFIGRYGLRHNLDFALIRSDPRFQELVQQYEAWVKTLPDPADL